MDCVRFLVLLVFLFLLFLSVVLSNRVLLFEGLRISVPLIFQGGALLCGLALVFLIYHTNNNGYFLGKAFLIAGAVVLTACFSYLDLPPPFGIIIMIASVVTLTIGLLLMADALLVELLAPEEISEDERTEYVVLAKLCDVLGDEYSDAAYVIVQDGLYIMYDASDGRRLIVPANSVLVSTAGTDAPPVYAVYEVHRYHVKYRENQPVRKEYSTFERLVLEVPEDSFGIFVVKPNSRTSPKPSPYTP